MAGGVEQAAHAPDHVGHGAVDEQRPEGEKDGHGAELHALGKGAGDERRGDDGEHELVDHVGLLGNGGGVVGIGREAHAAQEEVLEAADEDVAVAEGQRVADDGPENGDQAHHGEALHHGAEDVLLAHQAAVEERQAGAGHQQDQGGGDQHPGVVAGGLGILDSLLEGGDLGLGCGGLCGMGPMPAGPKQGPESPAWQPSNSLLLVHIMFPAPKKHLLMEAWTRDRSRLFSHRRTALTNSFSNCSWLADDRRCRVNRPKDQEDMACA